MACVRNGVIAILFFVSILAAQGVRATIVGRVTDYTAAVVPGAKITITNVGTNESRSVVANDNGEYAIPQLAPGQYTCNAQAVFPWFLRNFVSYDDLQKQPCDAC